MTMIRPNCLRLVKILANVVLVAAILCLVVAVPRFFYNQSQTGTKQDGGLVHALQQQIQQLTRKLNFYEHQPGQSDDHSVLAFRQTNNPGKRKKTLAASVEPTTEADFLARKRHLQEVCWNHPEISGDVERIFKNDQSGILYCMVPKAGCTFWKRVFHVANLEKDSENSTSVFSISRNDIHKPEMGGRGVPYNTTTQTIDKYPMRLLVARDPYSRLLSSYLDKSYLPDFWPSENMKMANKIWLRLPNGTRKWRASANDTGDFLRQHFNAMVAVPEFRQGIKAPRDTASIKFAHYCPKYLTFAQFVAEGIERMEPHWMPIHEICNPCQMGVTHLSSVETFTSDARPVLARMGLGSTLDEVDEDKQVNIELSMIVEYNFNLVNRELDDFFRLCITNRELAYRLWQNFQWRGYIDPDVQYNIPSYDVEMRVRSDLMTQLWRARESGLKNRENMKSAKKEFRRRAFMSLSRDLFERVTERYKFDFELFSYGKKRNELRAMYEERDKSQVSESGI